MFKSLVLKSVIFKHFHTYWSNKEVTNLFTRVPFGHPRCQGNLEHGVALHDLPQTEKNGTDFPDTEDPRLCLHQRSLVFLKDHGKWRHFLCMLLLKYFYIYTGGIIHSQLWLASPWQGREIKMCWINLNSEVKKKVSLKVSLCIAHFVHLNTRFKMSNLHIWIHLWNNACIWQRWEQPKQVKSVAHIMQVKPYLFPI